MKKQTTKYYVLLLLLAMFAAPGIAAYIFYQHPDWLSAAKVNKGTLLNPPVLVKALEGQDKWRVVYWTPSACDADCLKQLDILARVRLALGRRLYQVDQWLILSDKAPSLSPDAQSTVKALGFQVAHLSAEDVQAEDALFSKAQVFLADPNSYLILSYPSLANPDDVYKDLKLLLNTTENKNG